MNTTATLSTRNFAPSGQDNGVDFELKPGEILALTGPSSSRLLSCLRGLAGIEPGFGGDLQVAGIDVNTMDKRDWLQLRQRSGLVSSRVPLLSTMNGLLNVMLPLNYHRPDRAATADAVAHRLLDELGFDGPRNSLPAELDSTQRFYLQLARELILEPGILFIEEPFSMQAVSDWPAVSRRLVSLAASRNITLVIATTNLAFIQANAPRVLFVDTHGIELHETARWIAGDANEAGRAFLDTVTTWPREPAA